MWFWRKRIQSLLVSYRSNSYCSRLGYFSGSSCGKKKATNWFFLLTGRGRKPPTNQPGAAAAAAKCVVPKSEYTMDRPDCENGNRARVCYPFRSKSTRRSWSIVSFPARLLYTHTHHRSRDFYFLLNSIVPTILGTWIKQTQNPNRFALWISNLQKLDIRVSSTFDKLLYTNSQPSLMWVYSQSETTTKERLDRQPKLAVWCAAFV